MDGFTKVKKLELCTYNKKVSILGDLLHWKETLIDSYATS